MMTAREVVDRQVDAYNRKDVDGLVACYRSDAQIVQRDGTVLATGHSEIRSLYGEFFDQSGVVRADVLNRITVGSVVIDEEHVIHEEPDGVPTEFHTAVVYRVANGLILGTRMLD